ncbi:NERD domain-containing protein [bacterium]|nr:NERD domain-containing protein [bacterium]
MAYVLKDEHNLSNWLNSLTNESAVLKYVMLIEVILAVLFIIAGLIVFITKDSYGFLIIAGVLTFFAAGHWVKQYENYKNSGFIKRGREGEIKNSDRLERGLDDDYYIINDIDLAFGKKKSQIDHIVLGPNGIFVIETKNWRGKLIGNETDSVWKQVKEDKNGNTIEIKLGNPIVQNLRHVETTKSVFEANGINSDDVFSVVVVNNDNRDIRTTTPVLLPGEMVEYIKWTKSSCEYSPKDLSKIIEIIIPDYTI